MKIHTINSLPSKAEALSALDDLRAKIDSGEIIAFAAVGIEPDDCTMMWCGASKPVTRLRTMGAIQSLLYHWTAGDIS